MCVLRELVSELKKNRGFRPKLALLTFRAGFIAEYVLKSRLGALALRILYVFLKFLAQMMACGDIPSWKVYIDWGLYIPHAFVGTIMTSNVRIGRNCTILHGVTLGSLQKRGEYQNRIRIGNNVFIGAYAIILGNTTIGDSCNIGAGACLLSQDVPNDCTIINPVEYKIIKHDLSAKNADLEQEG